MWRYASAESASGNPKSDIRIKRFSLRSACAVRKHGSQTATSEYRLAQRLHRRMSRPEGNEYADFVGDIMTDYRTRQPGRLYRMCQNRLSESCHICGIWFVREQRAQ